MLSRRERQIMEIVYARGEASAAEIHAALPDPPSYSAVRALLAILVDKGHLKHRSQRGRYIYAPTRRRTRVGRSALRRVLDTFFEGSLEKAVAALLQSPDTKLSQAELERLGQLIQQARKEGR
jgi:predicted transcriptional regulator